MLEEREKSKKMIFKMKIYLIIYIGLGILVSPFMLLIFLMAHDAAPQINSLQIVVELIFAVLILLYFWGLDILKQATKDKPPKQ